MKTKKNIIIIISIALVAFILGWWLAPGGGEHSHPHGTDEAAASAETIWTCSMHPQVRQPDPGLCPICAMDLIPLSEDDDGDGADLPRLRLSERSLALMEVQTVPIQRGNAFAELRLPGRVAIDETRRQTLSAWFSGRVDQLTVAYTGQQFAAGDVLMELYSPEIYAIEEEVRQTMLRAANAPGPSTERSVAQARERWRLLGFSDAQINALLEQERPSARIPFHAPSGGTVLERLVSVGDYIERGTPLYTLADLSSVWVELEAFESELARLRTGQEVEVVLKAASGESLTGTVAFIDPVIDPVKRTARVRVDLENPEGRLKPGMLAVGTVSIRALDVEGNNPLLLPASAPLFTGPRSIVYVRVPDTERPTFEARVVTLGPRLGSVYPVISGLNPGENVVVHGQFKIDSELQIRGRPSMMSGLLEAAEAADDTPPDPRDPPLRHDFADTVDPDFGREMRPLLEAYLDQTEALAADDPSAAAIALQVLHETLMAIGQHRLSGDAHVGWMEKYDLLHGILHQALHEQNLENMRDHLQALTHAIESIYVNFGADQLPDVFRVYCPMVNMDEIGTWLQRTERVANPYWGSGMLRCGDVFGRMKDLK